MPRPSQDRAPMRWALAASLAVHLVIALTIPPLTWSEDAVETISSVRISRITIVRRPRPPERRPRVVAAHLAPPPKAVVAKPLEPARPKPRHAALPPPAVTYSRPLAPRPPVSGGTPSAGSGAASPQAAPEPAATQQQPSGTGTNRRRPGGLLPFGAELPDPVLDPGVLKQLAALGVHVTLVVVVGEDGRTKDVSFDRPLDPQVQARIESLLADANWDPAVCGGGIACEGSATIKL